MKVIFIIHPIVAIIFGLAFVIVPGQTLSVYGVLFGVAVMAFWYYLRVKKHLLDHYYRSA